MKKLLTFFAFAFFASSVLMTAQEKGNFVRETYAPKPVRMDANEFLKNEKAKLENLAKKYPQMMNKKIQKLNKTNAYVLGSQKKWFAKNDVTNSFDAVPSTCRKVGTNCYVFVEDSIWGGRVSQNAVDEIVNAFDNSSPANASKGIYRTDVETFGNPPDVDGDPRIIILILDIKDGYTPGGSYVGGFFDPINEYSNAELKADGYEPISNECEMYYLDANPTNLNDQNSLYDALGTLAHEFQHMIHFNYHKNQLTFINEGCSEVASVVCGFPLREQASYTAETNHYLFDWRSGTDDVLKDYSRAARFMYYFWDQYGASFLKDLVQSKSFGISGIQDAFSKLNPALDFNTGVENWMIANLIDNKTLNPLYGYSDGSIKTVTTEDHYTPIQANSVQTIKKLGAQYLSYKGGSNLSIKFTASTPDVKVKAIKRGGSSTAVSDVSLGNDFTEPGFGTEYNEIDFMIYNANSSSDIDYSYSSQGTAPNQTAEFKWDSTEPTGYKPITNDTDSLCVLFPAAVGGKLNSIKTAVRRNTGKINGAVFEYTGKTTSPLGKLLGTFDVPVSSVPAIGVPYPVPYQGWVESDVSALNISTDKPYAVAYTYNISNNGLMVTDKFTGGGPDNSFTYTTIPGSTTKKWIYYVANNAGDTVSIYLSRAEVSFNLANAVNDSGRKIPAQYAMQQNYPNPFNPSTTIRYQLPESGFVSLKLYNSIGQEVATLVNGIQKAGEHHAEFNARNLPTGVYIYSLHAGNFAKNMKMILLK